MLKSLQEIKDEMEVIRGEWNGDESGRQEDQANIAEEIVEKINEIDELLKELNG